MDILKTIKTETQNSIKRHGINASVTVTASFIELITETYDDAVTLQSAFDKSFTGVEDICDLSEIGEKGYMLTVRF